MRACALRSAHSGLLLAVLGAVVGAAPAGCGGADAQDQAPVPTLAITAEGGAELGALLRDWAGATPKERIALESRLRSFEAAHADEELGELARVLRAHVALARDELAQARALATPAALGPPGTRRDLATLVLGAIERREGKVKRALARLDPLADKMIDPWASAMLAEELTRAALASRQWRRAVRYMDRWVRQSDRTERNATLRRIDELLAVANPEALLPVLEDSIQSEAEPLDDALASLLVSHVAALAAARNDAALARSLLDRFRPLLGAQGEPIARLAASSGRPKITAGTLGLVLSLDRPELRDRSVDVAAGVAFGLGLPGSSARLVTRVAEPSSEGLVRALHALAADGAAVVIAGVTTGQASAAAEVAEAAELPLLLLTRPAGWSDGRGRLTFVLGEDDSQDAVRLLDAVYGAGSRRAAVVGVSSIESLERPSGLELVALPCGPELDGARLRAKSVDSIVVVDGARCGPEAVAATRLLSVETAFGLGVAGVGPRELSSSWYLSAGVFPFDPTSPPADLGRWMDSHAQPPSWWTAIGRDAAVLGWEAVRSLADVVVDDANEVAERRRTAAEQLLRAQAPLWTSDATGFGGRRQLGRSVSLAAPKDEASHVRR